MKKWTTIGIFLLFLFSFSLPAQAAKSQGHIKMATTTSTENSGLLDVLLPAFEQRYGIRVYAIAVGTGKALKLAENGDVDLVLVHAPRLEKEFVKKGFGIDRTGVFYNDFVVLGPKEDPARVKNLKKVVDVFKKIARGKFTFISRGDNSGTYTKEMDIWKQADISPKGLWYLETGQGMGTTLTIANEKKGYCLSDRGTFLSFEDK
ncbi:MAG: solute-binding protein, partial [Nitrospirae bacterium]|nr:solute-binding protein [Nitrospirota bacterium]